MSSLSTFKSPFPAVPVPQTSVWHHIVEQSKKYPRNTTAHIDAVTGASVNRGTFERQCLELASALRQVDKKGLVGLQRGSVVTVFSPNSVLYPRVKLALIAAGICGAFANATYVGTELAHAYKISKSSHMLVHPSLVTVAIDTLKSHLGYSESEIKQRVIVMSNLKDIPPAVAELGLLDIDAIITDSKPLSSIPERFDGEEAHTIASIYFSSGTTGLSKGVGLTHYNIVGLLTACLASWPYYVHGRDTLGVTIPVFHVMGAVVLVLFGYFVGVPAVIMPGFQPQLFLESIQKYRITNLALVPPLLNFLITHPLARKHDISSIRFIMVGAAPIAPAVFALAQKTFKERGMSVDIVQGYGLTESSASLSYNPVEYARRKPYSIGVLLANCEGKLVDEEGSVVRRGEPGELWVKGPNVFKEYVNNPQATAETFSANGYFKTGDVMVLDDEGLLTVVDRQKELIKYKGLQVAPAELEAILFTDPEVSDAGVIGVYSVKDTSEVPLAYVVPRNLELLRAPAFAQNAAKQAIQLRLKEKVAPYKALRGGIVFIDAIPRSASGKILRKELRAVNEARTEKSRL